MSASSIDAALLKKLAGEGGKGAEELINDLAKKRKFAIDSEDFARSLDEELAVLPSSQREEFLIPKKGKFAECDEKLANLEDDCLYFVGNSLGLQPRRTRQYVNEELDTWSNLGVNGHFEGARPWMPIDELVVDRMAAVVGAKGSEVAVMNSLTMNLHLLFVSFYRPEGARKKILYEADAFGSDFFAFHSQARLHNLDPAEVLVPVSARPGEATLRTEDIVKAIEEAGDTLAVVCFGTVQYYTGQYFDVKTITAAAHRVGAHALWDCAHAAGNVDLQLHEWGVDGACWCSYKYLNAGPGGIAGFFVHEKHHGKDLNILSGWWGQKKSSRFNMAHKWQKEEGAAAWRLSNPPVLQTVSLLASLELFEKTSMAELRGRSLLLTGYLELLLAQGPLKDHPSVLSVLTPSEPCARGAQLSLKFSTPELMDAVFRGLAKRGVLTDERKPSVIRVSPAPLYNTFSDIRGMVEVLSVVLSETDKNGTAPAAKRQKS
mmetsp:Transcript_47610/g.101913  ORF Transcript_47610/g.101913 Transcript_47610/m.101913 type:complete len:489 (-) Transcript_47610:24-1490(-)